MLYLLDTDMCSYIIRQQPLAVLQALETRAERGDELVISVITYAELMQGLMALPAAARKKREPYVRAFLQAVHGILSWDRIAADQWAVLYTTLKQAGTPIGPEDTMIAAHALSLNATLVTNNERHFDRVPELIQENWTRE